MKSNLGINNNIANITAYIIRGEIIDTSQRLLGIRAEGNIKILPAKYVSGANGYSTAIRTGQRINNHFIGTVIKKLKD